MLDEVRPYLIADGGNVRVMGVDVDRRVVSRSGHVESVGYSISIISVGTVNTGRRYLPKEHNRNSLRYVVLAYGFIHRTIVQ